MPTRILREGIISSESVNSLSEKSELLYRRLMSVVDDYGRYYAHPSLVRAACYPLKLDSVSEANVKQMLSEITSVVGEPILVIYGDGKYLQVTKFRQQTRSKSKFPEPTQDELLSKCKATVNQMRSESETKADTETGLTKRQLKTPSLDEVKLCCSKTGLPESDAIWFWNKCEANGWTNGGQKIKSWQHTIASWKAANYMPSQKPNQTNGKTVVGGRF